MDYEFLMSRALMLAQKAEGETEHYPMVGAILVKNGKVIAEGYFKGPGKPHAEVNAIKKAGKRARGASLIVNLEPCCHYGRTPPCTDAIITAGIKEVIAGMKDPNPLVNGGGFRNLRNAGIKVRSGVLERECRFLNRHFIKFITTRTPWVILKLALTADGKLADRYGDSKWITDEPARRYVHKLRSKVQVVMVGIGTVLKDDPELSVRLGGKKRKPRPLVVDEGLRIPLRAKVLRTQAEAGAIIACVEKADTKKKRTLEKLGAEVIETKADKNGLLSLKELLRRLGEKKIAVLLCEGGARLAGGLLERGLVDEVQFFYSPKLLIDGKGLVGVMGEEARKIQEAISLIQPKIERIGLDFLLSGLLREV